MMQPLYDKALSRGVASLTDEELLTLLVGDPELAAAVLRACGGSLAALAAEEPARLRMTGGLGRSRALQLLAAAEFGRRVAESRAEETDVIATSDDVVRLFRPRLEHLAHEECWVLYLTSSNRIVERQPGRRPGDGGRPPAHRQAGPRTARHAADNDSQPSVGRRRAECTGPCAYRQDCPGGRTVRYPAA